MSKEVATIHDYARMCASAGDCNNCPLNEIGILDKSCVEIIRIFPDKTNEIILKWCEAHPPKTYKQDFLEKFPNTILDSDNSPPTCKNRIYGICNACTNMELSCSECWNEPMEEK